MQNKALLGTVVAAVAALVLMLSAFIVPEWQSRTDVATDPVSGDISTQTYKVGMSTWSYKATTTDSTGNNARSQTFGGDLVLDDNLRTQYPIVYYFYGGLITDSAEASKGVEGSGIPAFILGIAYLVLLGAAKSGKGYNWFRPVALILCLLAAILTFVGVFLYSKVLNIGYSFVIWAGCAIFILLGGIFTLIPTNSPRAKYIPIVCLTVGLLLGVISFATPYWYSETSDVTVFGIRRVSKGNAGVRAWNVDVTDYTPPGSQQIMSSCFNCDTFHLKQINLATQASQDVDVTKCDDPLGPNNCYAATREENGRFKDFIPGGEKAMGCGIPALFLAFFAFLCAAALLRSTAPKHTKMVGIGCAFVGSGLAFLGLFLYAAVTSVGVSFVLYSAAGFLWVLAFCLGFGDFTASGGAAGFKFGGGGGGSSTPKQTNTTAPAKTDTKV